MAKLIAQNLDFNNTSKLQNIPQATQAGEPVEYSQFNSAVEGLSWKRSVRVATQANINIASPGATISGVPMAPNDRVLVRANTAQSENGIYIWNGAAVPMTRATDANSAAELEQAIVTVEEGVDAATTWRQTQVNFTLGSGNVVWTSFGTAAPPATTSTSGTVIIATQAEVDTGSDTSKVVTPATLAGAANRKLKFAANVGDGSATQIDITHNLNTRDVEVSVYRNATPWDDIVCDVERPDVNTVRLRFATAPSAAQFRAVIIG